MRFYSYFRKYFHRNSAYVRYISARIALHVAVPTSATSTTKRWSRSKKNDESYRTSAHYRCQSVGRRRQAATTSEERGRRAA